MKDRLHRGGGVRQQRSFQCHLSHFYDPEGDRAGPAHSPPPSSVCQSSFSSDRQGGEQHRGVGVWSLSKREKPALSVFVSYFLMCHLSGWKPQRAQTWTHGCKVKSALTGWRTTRQIWVDAEHRNTCLFQSRVLLCNQAYLSNYQHHKHRLSCLITTLRND